MLKKATITVTTLLLSVCLLIGYAVLSDNLFLYGEADIQGKPFEGVYISDVSIYSTNGVQNVSFDYIKPTNFSAVDRPTKSGGSITYKITVHNNTDVTYWYIKQDYVYDFESNNLISAQNGISVVTKDHPNDTSPTFNSDDWVPPHTYRDFYVTYTYGSNAQTYPSTFINFLFSIKMDAVHDKFLTALNDDTLGGAYDKISEAFDEKFAETGENVIANIGEEKKLFDELFGSNMTVTIDGVECPVTVMVRRENVDGRTTGDSYAGGSGCEYTVYITVDALTSPTGEAIVYAVSYSTGGVAGSTDTWHQLGQLYEGTANRIDYDPTTAGTQGAVDVYSWEATPNRYYATSGISYLVGQEQGDQYDKLKTLEQLMSTNDQDIFNDIDNTRILKTVYDIVYNSANTSKNGYLGLREAFLAAAPFYNVMNNGQEVKVKRQGTRAEILPYLERIQSALDFYNEVN